MNREAIKAPRQATSPRLPCDETSKDGDLRKVKNAMEDYPYKNKSLTGKVAKPLILELFDKRTNAPRSEIDEEVAELHRSRGGLPKRSETAGPIANALDSLRQEDPPKAYNQPKGFWHINSAGVDTDSLEYKLYTDRLL